MPELPEVQTTVNGLKSHVIGLVIRDAWSDYNSSYYAKSETIKNPTYFKKFRKAIVGKKILSAERRAKNILINLSGGLTIIVHLKMTGHLLYGKYEYSKKDNKWIPLEPESLKDPFNRHVRFLLELSNGKQLALCDTRRFAKVAVLDTDTAHSSIHLGGIGPEPLDNRFTFEAFLDRLNLRPAGKIKQVIMDQKIIAGIGNIYADESLWRAGIHPASLVWKVDQKEKKLLYEAIKKTLAKGIEFGGDSMSDYRNILGEKGKFQEEHNVYRRNGEKCRKPGCKGTIERIVIGGRGTHYCDTHQKLFK